MLVLRMLFLGQYWIFFLASKHCLNLECTLLNWHQPFSCPISLLAYELFPNRSFKLDVLFMDETAETSFNGFRVSFNWILLLICLCIFLKKINKNKVLSSEFLLILTRFYIINLLYRVLHFYFPVKIIHHTFPAYSFLFFSL